MFFTLRYHMLMKMIAMTTTTRTMMRTAMTLITIPAISPSDSSLVGSERERERERVLVVKVTECGRLREEVDVGDEKSLDVYTSYCLEFSACLATTSSCVS